MTGRRNVEHQTFFYDANSVEPEHQLLVEESRVKGKKTLKFILYS